MLLQHGGHGQRHGGHPPPCQHRQLGTWRARQVLGPSDTAARTPLGGHLLFVSQMSTLGSEMLFVPSAGQEAGLAAQGSWPVTLHDHPQPSLPTASSQQLRWWLRVSSATCD